MLKKWLSVITNKKIPTHSKSRSNSTSAQKRSILKKEKPKEPLYGSDDEVTIADEMGVQPSTSLRQHQRPPTPKLKPSQRKLATVVEEEEVAFKHQLSLLDDVPEWDLNAGIGSSTFETRSRTPPSVISTARASSPSKKEKVTESSKKNFHKIVAKIHIFMDGDDEKTKLSSMQKSKSAPDLTTLGGKGHAGVITSPESRGRSLSSHNQGKDHIIHSWRMPPSRTVQHRPHVREATPPSDLPSNSFESKPHEFSVMARTMWKHGEVRFEDQWGRRLIPIGRQDSFAFELWPVPEFEEVEE